MFVLLIRTLYSLSRTLSKWSYFNPLKETTTMTVAFNGKNQYLKKSFFSFHPYSMCLFSLLHQSRSPRPAPFKSKPFRRRTSRKPLGMWKQRGLVLCFLMHVYCLVFSGQQILRNSKGLDSKYFRLCRPYGLWDKSSTLLLKGKNSPRQCINKWVMAVFQENHL